MSETQKKQLIKEGRQSALQDLRTGLDKNKSKIGEHYGRLMGLINTDDIHKFIGELVDRSNWVAAAEKNKKINNLKEVISSREGQVRELQELNSGLEAKLKENSRPNSSQKKPWESKKFWVTITGIAASLASIYLNQGDIQTINEMLSVLAPVLPAGIYDIWQSKIDKANIEKNASN